MPGVDVAIVRPVWAEIAYLDDQGDRHTARLERLPARVAQHEIDQMNGGFFLDRLSRLKRDMVIRKWNKRAEASTAYRRRAVALRQGAADAIDRPAPV